MCRRHLIGRVNVGPPGRVNVCRPTTTSTTAIWIWSSCFTRPSEWSSDAIILQSAHDSNLYAITQVIIYSWTKFLLPDSTSLFSLPLFFSWPDVCSACGTMSAAFATTGCLPRVLVSGPIDLLPIHFRLFPPQHQGALFGNCSPRSNWIQKYFVYLYC